MSDDELTGEEIDILTQLESEDPAAVAWARRLALLAKGQHKIDIYNPENLNRFLENYRANARKDYAAKIMEDEGRPVRPYKSLAGMTPEEKEDRRREQTRERVRRLRKRRREANGT